MLVLSRLKGQRLLIGKDITIQVVRVDRGGKVRLGILAPRDVAVLREELAARPAPKPAE